MWPCAAQKGCVVWLCVTPETAAALSLMLPLLHPSVHGLLCLGHSVSKGCKAMENVCLCVSCCFYCLLSVYDQILAHYCTMLSALPGLEFGASPSYMSTCMDTNK